MKLILDEGMPYRTASMLREAGIDARHVLELEMGGASDEAILERARLDAAVVATLDADFHQLLATTGADLPSVIRVRIEGLRSRQLADLLVEVLKQVGEEGLIGVAISVGHKRIRIRRLPIRS